MARVEQQSTETKRAFSPDLFARFVSSKHLAEQKTCGNKDDGEVELSLGLSLNGRFGTDPRAKNDNYIQSLKRSSSISDFTLTYRSARESSFSEGGAGDVSHALGRTFLLPVETEEWRWRKVIQSLRRLEAKRKRLEKQRNGSNYNSSSVTRLMVEAPVFVGSVPTNVVLPSPISFQWSAGFHGCGSSGLSESDSLSGQGGGRKCSGLSAHSGPPASDKAVKLNGSAIEIRSSNLEKKGALGRNVLEDMPCVSTTGLGPNGKRVDGFLYRYRKGEEVRIVCVCHGSFLSPAEFVKHAGGGEVYQPLKHIVVNPTSFV